MTIGNSRRAALVALAATALTVTALAGPAGATTTGSGHQATQGAIEAAVAAGIPGVTAEARDANGTWKSATGVGDLRTGTERAQNDRFRVGGITSSFVATVLLQMAAEGKLSLDDSVDRFLPGLVADNGNDGKAITVRMLLNHTSGLTDYLADATFVDTYVLGDGYLQHRYETMPHEQRVKVALSHPPAFAPGTRHWFSNTNDLLAAMVVEKVDGRTYEDEVRRRIITPLGLTSTSHPGTATTLPRPSSRAYSKLYTTDPDRIEDVTEVNGSQGWGNGDIISSAADLNRFYGALMSGRLLPAQQLKEMKTTVVNPDFPASSYGLGVERLTLSCGKDIWYHDGGTVGWLSVSAMSEDGRHLLTFNYNANWAGETLLPVLEAEYCTTPARRTH